MYKVNFENLHTVNGELFRNVIWFMKDDPEKHPVHTEEQVYTPHCGWRTIYYSLPICTEGCDTKCKLCQIFFDEIGVEY